MAFTRIGGSWANEYVALSTDEKYTKATHPDVLVPNGSSCLEIDTGTIYLYDRENDLWCPVEIGEGGGGSGGTTNYNNLNYKPKINGVELSGNKTTEDLHLETTAGSIVFDESASYDTGSIGKEVSNQKNAISQLNDASVARAVALNNLIKKAAFADVLSSEYIDFLVAYGFNLFDPSTAEKLRMYIDVATMTIKYGNGADRSAYIRIKSNTTYKIIKDMSKVFRVGTMMNEPALNASVTTTLANHNGTEIEITSGATDQWLFITYFQTATSVGYDETTILNSIKVFEV